MNRIIHGRAAPSAVCTRCGGAMPGGQAGLCPKCAKPASPRKWWPRFSRAGPKTLCPNAACGHLGWPVVEAALGGAIACAKCRQALPAAEPTVAAPRVLAVLGTERCGKTSWLVRGLDAFCSETGDGGFPLAGQADRWLLFRQALGLGKVIPPTPPVPGSAWCRDWVKDGRRQRLYVHDLSGQETADPHRLARYRCFRQLDGMVIVVDAFGLEVVGRKFGPLVRNMRPPVEPSPRSFAGEHLGALVQALEMSGPAPLNAPRPLPVAVVVTKLDVMGLIRGFGEAQASAAEAQTACRRQLAAWGWANMLQALEARFQPVAYFACEPSGKGAHSPAAPFRWLLEVS